MNVITNNKPRMLLMWAELPEGIGESELDYECEDLGDIIDDFAHWARILLRDEGLRVVKRNRQGRRK